MCARACVRAGNVWIYSEHYTFTTNEGDETYCHPTLYWFAFWMTTVTWILVGLFLILFSVMAFCRPHPCFYKLGVTPTSDIDMRSSS